MRKSAPKFSSEFVKRTVHTMFKRRTSVSADSKPDFFAAG